MSIGGIVKPGMARTTTQSCAGYCPAQMLAFVREMCENRQMQTSPRVSRYRVAIRLVIIHVRGSR